MKIAGIEISHPDKIIFPSAHISKLQMVKYYESVADEMLPFLKNRPLTLHRFPDGISSDGFYQKKAADYFPHFIQTIKIDTEEGHNIQVICNNKKSLIYLANQGTVAFHTWLSKKDKLYKPDKIVFDLDPSTSGFEKVREAAKITAAFLRRKNKEPELMTSGKKGFHVYYSIRRTKTFDELHPILKAMAEQLESENPDLFTTSIRKDSRDGKIFIDYLRNSYAQTSVCPYSLRPNKKGGIATPVEWKDLKKIKSGDHFNLENILNKSD